jgi:hypothetical protein
MLEDTYWFSQSRSVRSFCPFRSSSSHTPPSHHCWLLNMAIMSQLPAPDPCDPHSSSASSISAEPFYWPTRLRRASLVCALTFATASCPPQWSAVRARSIVTLPRWSGAFGYRPVRPWSYVLSAACLPKNAAWAQDPTKPQSRAQF